MKFKLSDLRRMYKWVSWYFGKELEQREFSDFEFQERKRYWWNKAAEKLKKIYDC